MNDSLGRRVTWIFGSMFFLLMFVGCGWMQPIVNPGADDPDSDGGKDYTEKEKEQSGENTKKSAAALGQILAAFGLPLLGTGVTAAGSVAGNVYQWVSGKQYHKASKSFSKTIDLLEQELRKLDGLSDGEVDRIVTQALTDAGATGKDAKKIYQYLKNKGDL